MSKLVDITGNKYGKLTVIKRLQNIKGGIALWECRCDCGNSTVVRGGNLKSGAVKSCGCLRRISRPTHNMSHSKIYQVWNGIKNRCYNSNIKDYKNYGGRGITMCDEWKNSFTNFYEWAIASGYSEGLTIERINNNEGYNPKNCTWIPKEAQVNNRRFCRMITYNGKTQNLTAWCNELKLPYKLIHNRINSKKWSFERAISEPVHIEKRNKNYV